VPYPAFLRFDSEKEYREHFERVYCSTPTRTFDGIEVRFRKGDFDHCCFEASRRDGVKDRFSRKRAERLDWIRATLQDPNSELYVGWDKNLKRYDRGRRVALVMNDYVVVIALKGQDQADFVTAYVADTPAAPGQKSTIEKIRMGPRWA